MFYEGEWVSRSQIYINVNHMIFEPGEKHSFLDIASTDIDTRIPSLYQCVDTPQSFYCCLSRLRAWSGIMHDFRTSFREYRDLIVNRFTRRKLQPVNGKHFFMNILCIEFFWHVALRYCTPQARSPLWQLKTRRWKCACASATETVVKLDCAAIC
jgi:hypothetical protein